MGINIAIFEDDKDLADILKERMQHRKFNVVNYYSLDDDAWLKSDVVLGDFRNTIVSFAQLAEICKKEGIPILAISGAETGVVPQLLKPFSIVALEAAILDLINSNNKKKKS